MKLNGWQRIWVVLAALWLVPVVSFSIVTFPQGSELSDEEIQQQLTEVRSAVENRFSDLAILESQLSPQKRNEQIRHVAFGVGMWLVPIAVLYILGWATAWVRRGFRPKIFRKR